MSNRNSDKSYRYNNYGNSESFLQYLVHRALHQYCEHGGKYRILPSKGAVNLSHYWADRLASRLFAHPMSNVSFEKNYQIIIPAPVFSMQKIECSSSCVKNIHRFLKMSFQKKNLSFNEIFPKHDKIRLKFIGILHCKFNSTFYQT